MKLSRDGGKVEVDMKTVSLPYSVHEIVIQRVGFFIFVTSPVNRLIDIELNCNRK